MTVDIALATYNGERYISEMLDSIANQTHQDFLIHLRDDGSKDNTITICENHKLYQEGRLKIYRDKETNLGASNNFLRILKKCKADYVFLCDQDDFWMEDKISKMLEEIKKNEYRNGSKKPSLVFSDLMIVDSSLDLVAASFYKSSMKSSDCRSPFDFLLSNHIPGCSMVFNKELLSSIYPIPDDFRMHDWWIAFIASYYGGVFYLNNPLIKYRQHDTNTIGAPGMESTLLGNIKSIKNFASLKRKALSIKMGMKNHVINVPPKNIISNESEDFYRFLTEGMTINEKNKKFKKMKTGEYAILSYLVWMSL
ncbi:TPA: glycosyltransferase family 2 protein [Klebsiella pneumoniae]|nr:glycosyltransferase family 2 protein [Klebsiella pneumoniae]